MKWRQLIACLLPAAGLLAGAGANDAAAQGVEFLLDKVLAGEHRSEANRLRDQYRHPRETLLFFGLKPDMAVLEIWPGGGWYTEILAPVLRGKGRLFLALNPEAASRQREARPEPYKPVFTVLGPPEHLAIAPAGSMDLVLTFRNVHNWSVQKTDALVFKAFFDALKPGGVLGVVEHRAHPGTPFGQMVKTGYMTEAYVIELAEKAGFKFVAKSEVNANARDTRDHPHGVWTLPPTSRGRLDPEKYLAIGESDRMTIRFEKPVPAAAPARAGDKY